MTDNEDIPTEKIKKRRLPKLSESQKECLIELVEKNRTLNLGKANAVDGKVNNSNEWKKAAVILNEVGPVHKPWVAWRQAWIDFRNRAKEMHAKIREDVRQTGTSRLRLAPLQKKIIRILGNLEVRKDQKELRSISRDASNGTDNEDYDDSALSPEVSVVKLEPSSPSESATFMDDLVEQSMDILLHPPCENAELEYSPPPKKAKGTSSISGEVNGIQRHPTRPCEGNAMLTNVSTDATLQFASALDRVASNLERLVAAKERLVEAEERALVAKERMLAAKARYYEHQTQNCQRREVCSNSEVTAPDLVRN